MTRPKKPPAVKRISALEEKLNLHFKAFDVPPPVRELRFHKTRMWRFDFAWPDLKFAVEVEGVTYGEDAGRHQRGKGYENDLEKYHYAMLNRWDVYRCSGRLINSLEAVKLIKTMVEFKQGLLNDGKLVL